MRLRIAFVVALSMLTVGLLVAPPAGAAPVPEGATWQELYLPSYDGTQLHADLLRPADGCPEGGCPVIVSVGPYFGSGSQTSLVVPKYDPLNAGPSGRFHDFIAHEFEGRGNIFEQGYAWLQVDSRGYGGSDGCNDYGGIGEQMDAAAAVEWAGSQEWSNGKVGMWGKSYDAWTQVMATAMNPPHLEAVVIQSPIIDGYGIAYVNGVHHDAGWYATTGLYQIYDYIPPSVNEITPEEAIYPIKGTATERCWEHQHAVIASGWDRSAPHAAEYWRERDLRVRAGRNDDVAVLWSHGFNDVQTKPDQIFPVYDRLNDQPDSNHRAWFGAWAHDRGNESQHTGREGFLDEALDWFDHYLKGQPFRYGVNEHNVVEVQDNEGVWRTEAVYPPADVVSRTIPLSDGSYVDDGDDDADTGYWTASQPLPHDIRVTGEPTLNVTADIQGPYANLVGVLYDWDPETEMATEISRGAYRLSGDGPVSFTLHPRDHVLRAGHQLAFHINSGHPEFLPHSTTTTVNITEASVDIPVPVHERVSNLTGQPSSRSPYAKRPTLAQIEAATVEMPLPPAPVPYPDAATRESIQPTVSSPAG